ALADRLRAGMNQALADARVAGSAYGCRSILRLIVGDDLPPIHDPAEFVQAVPPARLIQNIRPPALQALHAAMLLEGLDVRGGRHAPTPRPPPRAPLTPEIPLEGPRARGASPAWPPAVMTEADIDDAVGRFARA